MFTNFGPSSMLRPGMQTSAGRNAASTCRIDCAAIVFVALTYLIKNPSVAAEMSSDRMLKDVMPHQAK